MSGQKFFSKIKQNFPEIKWKKYQHFTNGWDHEVIILDKNLVFRLPKDKPRSLESELYHEAQLLKYLKNKLKVAVPDYTYFSKNKTIAGYKILPGTELSPTKFKRLTKIEKNKIAKQLAEFLTTIHKISKDIIKKYHVRTENDQKNYQRLVNNTKKFVFPRLKSTEIEIIKKYLVELKNAFTHPNVFTHNDLCWEHIFWDSKKQKIGIIDFSDMALTDPAVDFTGLWEYGEEFVYQVYKMYQGKKDKNFLYRSKLYFQRTPLFVMKDALCGCPCTFQEGYKMFKERFN
jgi:aminoglycoside 2''-phosphotransferase